MSSKPVKTIPRTKLPKKALKREDIKHVDWDSDEEFFGATLECYVCDGICRLGDYEYVCETWFNNADSAWGEEPREYCGECVDNMDYDEKRRISIECVWVGGGI